MDTAKLWFMLLCVCVSWISSLALNCDWTTEYEHENRCCKACPSGHYPKVLCSKNKSDSECVNCSTATSAIEKCFCKDNHLCSDDKCENCKPREKCKPGQQLKRNGAFDYTYFCEPCPDNTYNDAEDSTCKSITKCAGGEIFPGNKTHNARCGSLAKFTTVHPGGQWTQNNSSQTTHSFMVACLIFTVLTCLVFVMYAVFKICTYKMRTKTSKPLCTHRMALPSDTCICKLSKEEEGDINTAHSEVLEVHSFLKVSL
ncbi:tumor necrosis factor receptor superfamily member 18 [Puntigrus tetrazona]|uniref:tumor necrosis factor receptor superfamily member 18 n=1 Tax=Puntigrus tetrazona TaxID=1606681 RepID=UPI001C892C5A|nr:tumor necrosis factor receptor superfamily member 18 [Puntigrus tetrazona]XP_043097949.1 tumor necrosis factor receptor superfamily member 18 [Puntigrus tetrazona]